VGGDKARETKEERQRDTHTERERETDERGSDKQERITLWGFW
jgi:hypothetical protein